MWKPFRLEGAAPTAPYQLRNDKGETLADAENTPIQIDAATIESLGANPENHPALKGFVSQLQSQQKQIADLTARAEADRVAGVAVAAASFAERHKDRFLPDAGVDIAALYAEAANDDHASPRPAGQPSRADRLATMVARMPPLHLTQRFAANTGTLPAGTAALPNATGTTPDDRPNPDAVFEALVASPDGRAMLATESGRKAIAAMPGGTDWLSRRGTAAAGSSVYPALAAMNGPGAAAR